MLKFIIRRILSAIPTMLVLITVSFFMMRLAPGSPFTGDKNVPPAVLANIEDKYHLNDPMYLQYFNYLKQLAHGDLGHLLAHDGQRLGCGHGGHEVRARTQAVGRFHP